jgi:hypothetical protein
MFQKRAEGVQALMFKKVVKAKRRYSSVPEEEGRRLRP